MLGINDLERGQTIIIERAPYQVMEVHHLHIGRGGSSVQTKLRNLITGNVLSRNFKPADSFEETEIKKKNVKFLYASRGEYWFCEADKPANRFMLKEEHIGEPAKFLKQNLNIDAVLFEEKIINIAIPIKIDYKVTEAPPGIRGDTAQGGTKIVTIESGAQVIAPLFINEGDIIQINTDTGEYVSRIEKSKI